MGVAQRDKKHLMICDGLGLNSSRCGKNYTWASVDYMQLIS